MLKHNKKCRTFYRCFAIAFNLKKSSNLPLILRKFLSDKYENWHNAYHIITNFKGATILLNFSSSLNDHEKVTMFRLLASSRNILLTTEWSNFQSMRIKIFYSTNNYLKNVDV